MNRQEERQTEQEIREKEDRGLKEYGQMTLEEKAGMCSGLEFLASEKRGKTWNPGGNGKRRSSRAS